MVIAVPLGRASTATAADISAAVELMREENVRVIAPGVRPTIKNVTIDYFTDGKAQQWTVDKFADYSGEYTRVGRARSRWAADAAAGQRPPIRADEKTAFLAHFERSPAPDKALSEKTYDAAAGFPQAMTGGWSGNGLAFAAQHVTHDPAAARWPLE